MSQDVNSVTLVGRLTRDPELRSTTGGTAVCSIRLAVGERYKNNTTGDWEDRSNYFDVTTFGAQAENCAKYLSKGRQICVLGRLRWREWESDAGKRQAVEIVANMVQFMSDGSQKQQQSDYAGDLPVQAPPAPATVPPDDDIPFHHDEFSAIEGVWHGHTNRS